MASKSRASLRDEFDDLYEGYEDATVLGAQKVWITNIQM